jgi:Pregnancy-associated plasma protein-A/Secretion system C-terminal sorting domain/Fibronectin type III domain
MKKLFFVFAAIIAVLGAQAQRNCGSMEVLERLKTEDPSYVAKMGEIEEHTAEFIRNHQGSTEAVITIPVVIHVLYNTSVQNITDAQILSQMDVLNEDFRLLNADHVNTPSVFAGLKADCEINFVLAKRDPNGNATTGIIRKSTTVTSWSSNDYVKYSSRGGDDAWPAGSYLNIWVCNLGGGLLGYAQFPGGATATDGVVIGYNYFGRTGTLSAPFNKGRTATHEVGHWLNLRHIWGDANCGNDLVDDTPTQQTSNYGCPSHPKITCSNVNGDMFMNYMDYTDDACMFMFSAKQKLRMQAVLAAGGSRATLATSLGGTAPTGGTTCSVPNGLTSSNVANTTATLNWNSTGATSYNVQYKLATATTWTTTSTTATSLALTGLTAGTSYNFQVQSVCSGGTTSAYSATVTFSTLAASGCGVDAYESNNTAATANTVSVSATVAGTRNGLICPAGDIDWFKFNNLSTAKNIKVTLTNLPADYDIYLYRSTSTTKVLKSSVNTGTTSESIAYNNGTVGTYMVKVQGYNNATNASGQYTLTIQIGSTTFRMNQDGTQQSISGSTEESLSNVNIYPNPANSMVNLEFNANQSGQAQIRFIDQMGRVAQTYYQTTTAGNNLMNLDINSVPAGVYFVQMISNEQTITKRLVISH